MTYDSLVDDLENYLQRYDTLVINQIPQFIMLAQQRIPREMKILGFRQEVTGILGGGTLTNGLMAKPADWRKTIAFYVGTGITKNIHTPVWQRDYDYIRTIYPDDSITDVPKFYGDADWNHWLIQPTSDQAYPFKIPYYATLAFLDETIQTNWLTINAPDLLLYACLLEANSFVKTDDRIQVWESFYTNAKGALQAQEADGMIDTASTLGEPKSQSVMPR